MTVAPYFFGVISCLAGEALIGFIFACIGYLISKFNEGRAAKEALRMLGEKLKGDDNERISE